MADVTQNIEKLTQILKQDKTGATAYFPEFHHILDEIRLSLDRQDSDGALTALIK
jgi:hypothetical protein